MSKRIATAGATKLARQRRRARRKAEQLARILMREHHQPKPPVSLEERLRRIALYALFAGL